MVAIGCDGTNVNTGTKGGVIKLFESRLKRPLHWFICMLHANELPLGHLFSTLDGKTIGPRCFTGNMGRELQSCVFKTVVNFPPVPVPPQRVYVSVLSTDKKYLYVFHQAVSTGYISHDLSVRSPGTLNHARWITTANRILRLYVSNENPSGNLSLLTKYVMEVYAPMWFKIKTEPYVQSGAKHLFHVITFIKKQVDHIQNAVLPVVMRNAYFPHGENIILAMLIDERSYIRELGWRRIKNCRSSPYNDSSQIRQFRLPKLNFQCTDYTSLIDWQTKTISEPPMTKQFSDDEIENFIEEKKIHLYKMCQKFE